MKWSGEVGGAQVAQGTGLLLTGRGIWRMFGFIFGELLLTGNSWIHHEDVRAWYREVEGRGQLGLMAILVSALWKTKPLLRRPQRRPCHCSVQRLEETLKWLF